MRREQLLKAASNAEERLALAKVLDLAAHHTKAYADFLDPVKAGKFYDLLSREQDIHVYMFGGYAAAERLMLGCCPAYMEITDSEFPIEDLQLSYDTRFSRELHHRDFLGSILGLGVDRSRVGDIVVQDDSAHVFVCREIAGYMVANLERVGAVKVNVTIVEPGEIAASEGRELRLTVASLRLDAVISAAFHLSRGKAAGLIAGEKAFVNWVMIDSASKQLTENDVLTVRGLGRIRVLAVDGRTKKDRLVVRIMKY